MIATAFFTGKVVNNLELVSKDEGDKFLSVLLKVDKQGRKPSYFYLEAYNYEALLFKQKVAGGDFVSIVAEPYSSLKDDSKKTKDQYVQGYKIILFEVLKRGDIKWQNTLM